MLVLAGRLFYHICYTCTMSIEPSTDGPSISLASDTREVPRLVTRLSESEIATVLDLGHVAAFNVSPSPARLSLAWALVCHENARGEAIHNFDIGNVDATDEWYGDVMSLTADEGEGASVHKQTKWLRAYPDAFSGAVGWWRFMADHHETALAAFDSGDGERSADALKRSGYFTGPLVAYRRELRLLAAEFVRRRADGSL